MIAKIQRTFGVTDFTTTSVTSASCHYTKCNGAASNERWRRSVSADIDNQAVRQWTWYLDAAHNDTSVKIAARRFAEVRREDVENANRPCVLIFSHSLGEALKHNGVHIDHIISSAPTMNQMPGRAVGPRRAHIFFVIPGQRSIPRVAFGASLPSSGLFDLRDSSVQMLCTR